jgi:hypothetical protein
MGIDQRSFRVFHAFGSRWTLTNDRLPVVAGSVISVILAKLLTRHEVASGS